MNKQKHDEKRRILSESIKTLGRIIRDTKPIMPWLILAAVLSLVSILLAMSAPELVGDLTMSIYEYCTKGTQIDSEIFLNSTLALGIVYILSAVIGALTMALMNNVVSRHFTCRIRIDMSRKISKIPVKKVDGTPNGEIISRMTNDVSIMGGSVHDIFNIIINGLIRLIVISIIIFASNPIMASALVIFVPASMFLSAKLAAKSEKHFNESRTAAGKIYALTEENLTGFDTVKAFSAEKQRQDEYEALAEDYKIKSEKAYKASGVVQPIISMINSLSYVVICVIGGILAIYTDSDVGDLVTFVLYTKLFAGPLESIAGGMSMMQSTIASAKRVYEFLDDEEMSEEAPIEENHVCRGEVVFENVAFSYVKEQPLIENLNLSVKPGEKIAIVGPTGGGKTTIVNLLMRFYDPDLGRIIVDGCDIGKTNREDVRSMFGMVLQDTMLFSGSVYDNIAYGKNGATKEEVIEAARRAHIDTFIESLPDGYDTVINEESTNISAGQKQLLTIARAYLSARPILILDEATSNVDTRTELIIQKTMDELMNGKTSFVIAHRLSTIENADLILVIDKGRVVEMGKHTELVRRGGLYSKIHSSQYAAISGGI